MKCACASADSVPLLKQNNISARPSGLFVHFLAVTVNDHDVKCAEFTLYGGHTMRDADKTFSRSELELDMVRRNSTPAGEFAYI